MRTIFDQYVHPENRLTHALAATLAEDSDLLRAFLRRLEIVPPRGALLRIVEQRLPGETDDRTETSELDNRRLPDAWIYTDSGWALLIESKVAAPIDPAQLRGHLAIAERRGFSDVRLLVLSPVAPVQPLPDRCIHRRWSDLYSFACAEAPRSRWATHLMRYLPVAEQRMIDDAYLKEGTLTTFAGIPFGADYLYNYLEAKRLLRLLMGDLRADTSLDALGIDRAAPGRTAITGSAHTSVWDFLSLAHAVGDAFTRFPHFTISVERDRAIAHLTVPNGLDPALRRVMVERGYDGLRAALADFVDASASLLAADHGATPYVQVLQRHYPGQRSTPIRDAILEFDARTALGGDGAVRSQEEWLRATVDALARRQSNLQLSIGVAFPYGASTRVGTPEFARAAASVWIATKPVLGLLDASGATRPSTRRPEPRARKLPRRRISRQTRGAIADG